MVIVIMYISTKRLLGIVSQLPSGALYIIHDKDRISFYEKTDSGKKYLSKRSDLLYTLARKRYLLELLRTIDSTSSYGFDSTEWNKQFNKLSDFLLDIAKGRLDVARVVLTPKQYK